MQVKVRKNATVNDKPKVYLSAHPKEFHKLERVAMDILEAKDCAVFYYGADECANDDNQVRFELQNMNLFVFVVTFSLLEDRPAQFLRDMQLAEEYHIPILPLMMEQELQLPFSELYGDMQWLYAGDDEDPTAIPYSVKLQQHLSLLFPDTMKVENIREAFSGTAFLSYRKKDRRLANELMHLLHQQRELLGLSIWYDEFLTPGQDFNRNIHDAMTESDTMLLLVTPNIVADNNYVMRVEYPAACSMGKEIIPVEMERTDNRQLEREFQGISPTVDVKDEKAFWQFLHQLTERFGLSVCDESPRRDYLIGLAYLYGLRVEKNSEIGVMMIRSAAEAGLDEAVGKMACLYANGEGVKRDTQEAVRWYEQLIKMRTTAFENGACEETAVSVLAAMLSVAKLYQDREALSQANAVYADKIEPFAQDGRVIDFRSVRVIRAHARKMRGENLLALGEHAEARFLLESAADLLTVLIDESATKELILDSIECLQNAGDVCEELGQTPMYRTFYLRAVKLWEQYEEERFRELQAQDYHTQKRAFSFYKRTAQMHLNTAYYHKAIAFSDNAVSVAKGLEAAYHTFDTKLLLASAYIDAVLSYDATGDQATAASLREAALQLAKEAATADEHANDTKRFLAVCYEKLSCLDEAAHLFREIEAQTHAFRDIRNLYRCFYRQACALYKEERYDEALELLTDCLALNEDVLQKAYEKTFVFDLADTLTLIGKIHLQLKKYAKGTEAFKKANEHLAAIAEETGLMSAYVKYINSFDNLILSTKLNGRFSENRRVTEEKARVYEQVNATLEKMGRPRLDDVYTIG